LGLEIGLGVGGFIMRTNFTRKDPSAVIVDSMTPASGTGNYRAMGVVRIPITASASSTGTGWVNPEAGTVCASVFYVVTTGGTGTIDVGIGNDGTGVANGFIDGGTMTVGAHYPAEILGTVAASATAGGEDKVWQLIGPGGTGTNNSVLLNHDEAATSTAVGALIITYFPIEA